MIGWDEWRCGWDARAKRLTTGISIKRIIRWSSTTLRSALCMGMRKYFKISIFKKNWKSMERNNDLTLQRKREKAPYCLTQCSNGCSFLLFPRQDNHVQKWRKIIFLVSKKKFLKKHITFQFTFVITLFTSHSSLYFSFTSNHFSPAPVKTDRAARIQ